MACLWECSEAWGKWVKKLQPRFFLGCHCHSPKKVINDNTWQSLRFFWQDFFSALFWFSAIWNMIETTANLRAGVERRESSARKVHPGD